MQITHVERQTRSKTGDFLIGEHKGVKLVSCAANEWKIRQLMTALDRALDRCEDTIRCTGHPILCCRSTSSRNRFHKETVRIFRKSSDSSEISATLLKIHPVSLSSL